MDIHDSSLDRYKPQASSINTRSTGIANYERVQNARITPVQQQTKSLDLKQGQIVKGEIIDLRSNSVSILIESGKQILTAKLANDLPLAIGQSAQFLVADDSQGQITLRYLPPNNASLELQTADKALLAANLPKSDRNRLIVTELIKHNMPVDKQSLMNMIRLTVSNPGTDPLTLILMQKNKIPVTPENIAQFQAHQNGTTSLSQEITTMVGDIMELLHANQTPMDNKLILHNQLLNMLSSKEQAVQAEGSTPHSLQSLYTEREITQITSLLKQNIQEQQSPLPLELQPALEQLSKGNITLSSSVSLVEYLFKPEEVNSSSTSGLINPSITGQAEVIQQTLNAGIPTILSDLWNQSQSSPSDNFSLNQHLNPQELSNLETLLDPVVSKEMKVQIGNGSLPTNQLIQTLQQELPNHSTPLLHALLQSPEYLKVIREGLQQKWTLNPQKLKAENGLNQYYQELEEDTKTLKQLLSSSKNQLELDSLRAPIKDIQDNLQFVKSLNDMFTYIPLPLQFKDKETHGELYVFTQKNALTKDSNQLSVMLHLTMENLGSLNVFLQMDHTVISSKFYIEDREAYSIIKDHLNLLTSRLEDRGFQFQAEAIPSYEPLDFTKEFIDASAEDINLSRYNFDIRA